MRLNSCLVFFVLSSLFLGLRTSVNAQKSSEELPERRALDADDVLVTQDGQVSNVVSASRTSKSIQDLPLSFYVITKEQIRNNGWNSLTDVMKHVPGVRVSQPGTGFSGETFMVRGLLGNDYCKILINDVPVQPSVSGGIALGEQLPVAQAERIEIIFGPSAALYGADAMAGVINIITEVPESTIYARANASAGEFGYRNLNFTAGGKVGKDKDVIRYSIYGGQSSRADMNIKYNKDFVYSPLTFFRGFSDEDRTQIIANPELFENFMNNFPNYVGTLEKAEIAALPNQSYTIGGDLKWRGFRLSAVEMYRSDPSSLARNAAVFRYNDPGSSVGEHLQRFRLGFRDGFGKFTLTSNLSYLRMRQDPQSSVSPAYDDGYDGRTFTYSASDDIFGEVLLAFRLNDKFEFVSGAAATISSNLPKTNDLGSAFNPADYRPFSNRRPAPHELFGDFGFNPITYNSVGAFAQMFATFRKFSLVAGIRTDVHSEYKEQNYQYSRLAGVYKLGKKSSLRASIGFAFKAPSPDQIYSSLAFADNGNNNIPGAVDSIQYEQIPNTDLQPEDYYTFELGFRHNFSDKLYFETHVFAAALQQQISARIVPVDKEVYPLASVNSFINSLPEARQYVNSELSAGALVGWQSSLVARNLFEPINLSAEFFAGFFSGSEEFAEDGEDGVLSIERYRRVPNNFFQFNVSFMPVKKVYVSFANVVSGPWLRGFIPDRDVYDDPRSRIEGYYTMDCTLAYRFNRNIRVFGRVLNVFDAEYGGIDGEGLDIDLLFNPQYGRNIRVGLNFVFN